MSFPPKSAVDVFALLKEKHNLSTRELARSIGVSHGGLAMVLCGNTRLSPKLAMRLCCFFALDIDSILEAQAKYEAWQVKQDGLSIEATLSEVLENRQENK
ncbi:MULTISPECIES: helix-turn-helix transcriptional regulator [Vibrio]|jgi:plasmid maintenance system antidote protein VapI|uniref:Transcriptional regulator n=2 Tax=Vibrio TaxID=662 RepID=A0ABX5DGV1_9VIBR|nr:MULTISPECIES: transcriptional regulator [Vibrio]MCF4172802.1 transcriptional regulator [Vibrio sp. McD22-P3]MCG9626966.1 transcriptional regulator [Vibrio mediterranei]MCG9663526.1 transcriptional regulator [Vibrio mediterranei]NOH28343.1 transcriptional regulator [Vibrio mediterranei]NOI22944.1 transcriptional regulator [Vibrio mediterranei]